MSSSLARVLVLIFAVSPCAATSGTLNVHPSTPAPPGEPEAQRTATRPAPATPEIGGRSEADWRAAALARQHALESTRTALAACEMREAPPPYRDYDGYYRPAARARDGYRWVEIKNCDEMRLDLDDAQRDLDDFEEAARRSSVPPGWMR